MNILPYIKKEIHVGLLKVIVISFGIVIVILSIIIHYKVLIEKSEVNEMQFKENVHTMRLVLQNFGKVYEKTKQDILMSQLSSTENPAIMIFGDSIIEQMYLPSLDGRNVFNAGISGSRVVNSGDFLKNIISKSKIKLIVFSMGTNDAFREFSVGGDAFYIAYKTLVDAALKQKVSIILTTIPPLELPNKGAPLFAPESVDAFNEKIKAIGTEYDLPVVDINALVREKNAQREDRFTVDGVHLNGTYARFWRDAVYAVIQSNPALADIKK